MLLRFHQWFLFIMGGAFVCDSLLLLHASAMDTPEKRSNDYGYHFNVTSVDRCPMNISERVKAEARLGCKENHGYHCIPDKYHFTLIEFCYPKKRILVHTGNCLELADIGILNHVKCQTFSGGCPEAPYYSNEMYRYPVCLSVAFDCFTSDIECLKEKFEKRPVEKLKKDAVPKQTDDYLYPFIIILLVLLVSVLSCCIFKRKVVFSFLRNIKTSTIPTSLEVRSRVDEGEHHPLNTNSHADRSGVNISPHDEGPREALECKHLLEDVKLLFLLRRHCTHGAFENFDYLLRTRILNKENDSFKKMLDSLDKDGCSLLHYAARGGSVDILETLLKHCSKRNLNDRDYLGRTLLHIACKHGRYDMCAFLLSKEDYRKSQMNIKSKHHWNAAHFTAECGNYRIFEFLRSKKFVDMQSETENGYNILDIACSNNQMDFFKEIIAKHSELNPLLYKSDTRDWNITHILASVGNKDILEFLLNGYIDIEVAKEKTHHEKTILHICCENGHYELCKFIVENDHLNVMLGDIDHNRWNALHFCAMGGNLDAFKFLESKNVYASDDKTQDCKTALHISCIHKHVEIAKYLCNKLKSTGKNINELKTKTWWTPAHYVAVGFKQDGPEEELIRILVDAGIDLTAKTKEGKTVLIVACEHRNKTLVRYLVKEHPELLKIETDFLKKAAECDAEIKDIIDNAFKNSS